jgi:hypothetical protein
MTALPLANLLDGLVAWRLWAALQEMARAWLDPDLGFRTPPGVLVGILVFGVFLVVAGMVLAAPEKGRFGRILGLAGGAALAGWVFFGGRADVSTFFVVILLVLKFLDGVTFVLGMFRSFWGAAAVLVAVVLASTGVVEARHLAFALSILASLLGALSLLRKAEEFSPGKKGSRWNRRTAVGWVACLFAAGMLESRGLAAHGRDFKIAGIVVGAAVLLLAPSMFGAGVRVKLARK